MRSTGMCLWLALCACSKSAQPHASPASVMPARPKPTSDLLEASVAGVTWSAPKPLVARTPKTQVRAAEYAIQGDFESELLVFYFGPDQGDTEATLLRWAGQFKRPDGSDAEVQRRQRDVHGLPVALIETHGLYDTGTEVEGVPVPISSTDRMLLGAIAKGPRGSVYFKLIGPSESVDKARHAFDALIGSLH